MKTLLLAILISTATNYGCGKLNDAGPTSSFQLFVPTAFTPNGDHINDTFKVFSPIPLTSYHISIYDNNNIVVYEGTDIKKGWTGYYEGSPEPIGSYFWVINYQAEGTPVYQKSGSVQLIR